MLKRFFSILKREDGQIVITDLLIAVSALTFIGFIVFITLTPTVENSHQELVTEVKTLKGGGM